MESDAPVLPEASEAEADAEPESEAETLPEPEALAEPEPEAESELDALPEPVAEPEAVTVSEPVADSVSPSEPVAEAEAESFRLEDNRTLLYGEPELFLEDLPKLREQNRAAIAELDRLTQQYQKYAEELKELKIEQGFTVPKVRQEDDFFSNLEQINQYLRADEKDETMLNGLMRRTAEVTKNSMTPIGKQMLVHRSLSRKAWEEMAGKQLSRTDNVVGYQYDFFQDKCFCRASFGEEAPDDVQLVIAVSKEIRARHVSGIAAGGKDGLLLPPETEYHIIKQERLANGNLRVYVSASN